MAELSQTAANVAIGASTTKTKVVQYGEAVTQGNVLYQSTTDSKYYKADANNTSAEAKAAVIALTPGSTNGYGLVAIPATSPGQSLVNVGATLTVGETYVVGTTAGAIRPIGDASSGQYATILGQASTASLLDFQIVVAAVAKA